MNRRRKSITKLTADNKDEKSTSSQLGFRITGYKYVNLNGETEVYYKIPYKTCEETKQQVKMFFIKSFENDEIIFCKESL